MESMLYSVFMIKTSTHETFLDAALAWLRGRKIKIKYEMNSRNHQLNTIQYFAHNGCMQ